MQAIISVHWVLLAACWYFGNGILHTIFVLREHRGIYNRELLRLLMDGHLLILSGSILFVAYMMMLNKIQSGVWISMIVALGMLVYCALIFPFLKSFGTMFISLMVIIVCLAIRLD